MALPIPLTMIISGYYWMKKPPIVDYPTTEGFFFQYLSSLEQRQSALFRVTASTIDSGLFDHGPSYSRINENYIASVPPGVSNRISNCSSTPLAQLI